MDITENTKQKYELGHNPSIRLTGVTYERLYLTGTGVLDLDIYEGLVCSENAFRIEGFDQVRVHSGTIEGGILGTGNTSYLFYNLDINNAYTGVMINQPEEIGRIDLHKVHIKDTKAHGINIGPSRSLQPWINFLGITDSSVINTALTNLYLGSIKFGDIRNSTFSNNLRGRNLPSDESISEIEGAYVRRDKEKDIILNPNTHVRLQNVNFESLFVHPRAQLNIL